jgi:hypothetical protein
MKTDDYKQELRLSATLYQTNAKIFFAFKKKRVNPPENFSGTFVSCYERWTKVVLHRVSVLKKRPLGLRSRLGFLTTFSRECHRTATERSS